MAKRTTKKKTKARSPKLSPLIVAAKAFVGETGSAVSKGPKGKRRKSSKAALKKLAQRLAKQSA